MTARILKFPERGRFNVRVEREDQAWLVLARGHGWLFGCYREALREARWLSRNLDFPIRGEVGLEGAPR